jgi:chloramphenicol-sensitive protein RarD
LNDQGDSQQDSRRAGLAYGVAAYGLWGIFPLYFPLLEPSGPLEILAHRMIWSLVVVAAVLLVLRRWAWIPELLRQPKRLGLIALAALAISINWGTYIWGVNSGHVVETSLGYFINPLVTIALGVIVLHERLRPAQWAAVGIGAAAVIILAIASGRPPWIALTLAFSFGTYGFIKKKVNLGGLESLAAETSVQFFPALLFLVVLGVHGDSTFATHGPAHASLIAASGLITAIPLVAFGAAAIRVPLSTMGLLQYLAPVFQFLLGLTYFHESMPPARWAGFALVWAALTVMTGDALRNARRTRTAMRAAAAAGTPPRSVLPGPGGTPARH